MSLHLIFTNFLYLWFYQNLDHEIVYSLIYELKNFEINKIPVFITSFCKIYKSKKFKILELEF